MQILQNMLIAVPVFGASSVVAVYYFDKYKSNN